MRFILASFLFLISISANAETSFEIIVPQEAASHLRSAESREASSKYRLLKFQSREDLLRAVQELQDAEIDWEPNYRFSADVVSDRIQADLSDRDPRLRDQWSLYNPSVTDSYRFYGGDIDWLRAVAISQGKGRLVVVDSGVDSENSELSGKVVEAFDATRPNNSQNPSDQNGHGTHVASIVTASENSVGIVGVAPSDEVEVVNVRMLGADNSGTTDDALRAFDFVRQSNEDYFQRNPEGFVVINNSWGGSNFSQSLLSAMADVAGPRVLFVTSAGNDGRNNDEVGYWPCNYNLPNNICVAASDASDFKTAFSSYGRFTVDLLAPGLHILGSVPNSANYVDKSGTSQAAPHVAGAALLVWGANPQLSAAEVKQILLASVDRLPGAESEVLSGGRLNVYRAVLMATGRDPSQADRSFNSQNKGGGGCSLQMNTPSNNFNSLWVLGFLFAGLCLALRRRA